MEDRALPRREREKLRQREEMLAAALELFSKKGYPNVSMHEIARRAEFAIGTIYKFFKNKEELYRALVLEDSRKFRDALLKAIIEPDQEIDKLRSFVKAKHEVFRAHIPMIRLYFAQAQGASMNPVPGLDCEIRQHRGDVLQTLASVFESGMKRKRFRKVAQPFYLAVALDSLTSALLLLWLEAPQRHPYPQDPDVILNILFKGLGAS
jgi:TetR/AcrR family transcriptional regulator